MNEVKSASGGKEANQTTGAMEAPKKSKLWLWIVLLLIVAAVAVAFVLRDKKTADKDTTETTKSENSTTSKETAKWKEGGVAIAGKYADAEVVDLGNGNYRIYYSAEPETPNFNGQIYTATSTDGVTWTAGVEIKQGATFPDVVKLPDNRWRMYYQQNQVIKSAISADGLSFTDEPGTRIDKTETGFTIDNMAASSTALLSDGTFLMVYRGLINVLYSTTEKLPNQTTQLFFYATSTDGLTWQKKGLALDSRNETLLGFSDGAELVQWDDDKIRLYFWSYKGVYHTTYENGLFVSTPTFDFTNSTNPNVAFSENPPGDPTLMKINNIWYMYYGQHTKGIYYATLQ